MQTENGFDSNYRYILVAARRARQLQSGAPTLVDTKSRKACKVAQEEIKAGKIAYSIVAPAPAVAAAEPEDQGDE
jgi:DNA-directed RNA polymerase subunit omega